MKCIFLKPIILIVFIFISVLLSCESENENKKIDISGIELDLTLHRFDQALFSIPSDSIPNAIPTLKKEYGGFFELFCSQIIHIGDENSRDFVLFLQKFVSDFNMQKAYDDSKSTFTDLTEITKDLNAGFKHYTYYFKNKPVPEIYTYMGGFNQSIVVGNSFIGIGLDKYLGKNNSFYKRLGLPSYQINKMQKTFIVADCFRANSHITTPSTNLPRT